MNIIRSLLARQPTIVTTVVTAAVGLAIAYGAPIPADAKAPLIALLVALATAFLHQAVVSPATVTEVARQTAESLSGPTAGAVGSVTARGEDVVDTVVSSVGGLVGALAPKLGGK
jgi:hypothetical protein